MHIGFDAKRAYNNKTGLGNYSRFVLDALTTFRSEHKYVAYTPKNNRNLFPDFPFPAALPKSWLDKKLSAYWRHTRITKQLIDDKIDVFHGLSHELPQGLKEARIGSVVTIHDLIFERLPHLFNPIDRLIYRYKFKSACKRANVIIAISEQTKRDLTDLYKIEERRIKVIYQDCNPLFKTAVEPHIRKQIIRQYAIDRPYILCVGTLEERKNQLRLAEAFSKLANNDFQLVLVGKATSYTQEILQFIKNHNQENRILVLENVPTAHLPALYQEAEIFAYISVYEGFGIPILEALHSGTPVLAAKGSCLEEAGGPGGLYADPTDIDDIALQLQTLISDAELRKSLISEGQKYIQRFSAEIIAGQLATIYQQIAIQN